MESEGLLARIRRETGLEISGARDQHILSGLFNRYRPNGEGLDRILAGEAEEGAVRDRIQRVFKLTASSWSPGDIYFVLRRFEPIDESMAVKLVRDHFNGIALLADLTGDVETRDAVRSLTVERHSIGGFTLDESVPVLIYECLTDFLAKFQPDLNELFILKEALYSMTNDYFLAAYLLWPVIQASVPLPDVLDAYFAIWRHGLKLDYIADGFVFVRRPT